MPGTQPGKRPEVLTRRASEAALFMLMMMPRMGSWLFRFGLGVWFSFLWFVELCRRLSDEIKRGKLFRVLRSCYSYYRIYHRCFVFSLGVHGSIDIEPKQREERRSVRGGGNGGERNRRDGPRSPS